MKNLIYPEDHEQEEITEFTRMEPIKMGLLISALAGVAISLMLFLVVWMILEGLI